MQRLIMRFRAQQLLILAAVAVLGGCSQLPVKPGLPAISSEPRQAASSAQLNGIQGSAKSRKEVPRTQAVQSVQCCLSRGNMKGQNAPRWDRTAGIVLSRIETSSAMLRLRT